MKPTHPTRSGHGHAGRFVRAARVATMGAVVFFSGVASPARAIEMEKEDTEEARADFVEPILTEETMPNEPRELSLRVTSDYREDDDEDFGMLPKLEVFYGLAHRWAVEAAVPMAYRHDAGRTSYGIGDVSLSVKYLLVEPDSGCPAVVIGLESDFPTGDDQEDPELGEGAYELTPFLALLEDFGPLVLQGNFGWSKQISGGDESLFVYNWALAVPLLERRLHLLAEVNGEEGDSNDTSLAPGVKYNFTDEIFFGVAAPFGVSEDAPDWGVVTQFQVGFEL